ncbi:MAG: SurA N-terminal domain-containing protein [Aliishimia sp.]
MAKSTSMSKTAVWILLALLILGLAGFGATSLGGNIRTIGTVGDLPVSTQSYALAMQREMRAVQAQTGQPIRFEQARAIGLDQAVLQRLITFRALDHEAAQLGISVGDENVRDQVLAIPNFQGLDGSFDREAYRFALEQQGLSEGQFETQLREESARNLLQSAIANGIEMPPRFADVLVNYAGETRDFTWTALDASMLDAPLVPASDADIRAFYDQNIDQFRLPVTKRITYAWLTPDMLADSVELDEAAFENAYNDRIDEFVQPERRLVERLVYLDEDAAATAAASLEVGGNTFEAIVEERGLTLADVDMGDVSRLELDAAGEAVFNAQVGDVVGPLPSPLGVALFRVNGVLPAQSVSLEDARPRLRDSIALARARRIIEDQAEALDDLLAGGATLEELVAEGDIRLATIDWSEQSGDDIASYEDFRNAAAELTLEDFPVIANLDDGGIFAMRLEEELPERPEPFETAFEAASVALEQDRTQAALKTKSEALLPDVQGGTSFEALGLTATIEEGRTREAFIPATPPSFLPEVFQMEPGDVRIVAEAGRVLMISLQDVSPPEDTADAQRLRDVLQGTLDQSLAQDMFDIYTTDVTFRAEARIDPRSVDAVNVNFQ